VIDNVNDGTNVNSRVVERSEGLEEFPFGMIDEEA
jgi:hypothetical protein